MRSIVILAAGKGERMGDLSIDQPKCLLPIPSLGRNSLVTLLTQIIASGWNHIVIVGGYQIEKIRAFLATSMDISPNDHQKIVLIDASPQYIRGPLYSFLAAQPEISPSEHFWVCPSDTIFAPIIYRSIASISAYLEQHDNIGGLPRYDFLISYSDNVDVKDKHCIMIDPESGTLMITSMQNWSKYNVVSSSSPCPLLIPILGLSAEFFSYALSVLNQGDTHLYPVLLKYLNSHREIPYYFHTIPFQPHLFTDLDHPSDLKCV